MISNLAKCMFLLSAWAACATPTKRCSQLEVVEKTIDYVVWSDDMPGWGDAFDVPVILGHVVEREGAHAFTGKVDKTFSIEADGFRALLRHGTGGCSNTDDFFIVLRVGKRGLEKGKTYRLRPRNSAEGFRWKVPDGELVLVR